MWKSACCMRYFKYSPVPLCFSFYKKKDWERDVRMSNVGDYVNLK